MLSDKVTFHTQNEMEVLAQTFKNILWQKKKKILKTTGTTYMLSGGVRAQILLQRHSAEENEENILVQYSLTCAWSDYFTVFYHETDLLFIYNVRDIALDNKSTIEANCHKRYSDISHTHKH